MANQDVIADGYTNKETIAAMKEAERGDNLETLDLDNFRSYVDSL